MEERAFPNRCRDTGLSEGLDSVSIPFLRPHSPCYLGCVCISYYLTTRKLGQICLEKVEYFEQETRRNGEMQIEENEHEGGRRSGEGRSIYHLLSSFR